MGNATKDDQNAAAEAALKALCPIIVRYVNAMMAVTTDGRAPVIDENLSCQGHDTMEQAILCHEANAVGKWEWADKQAAMAKRVVEAAKKSMPLHERGDLVAGEFRCVILKETIEFVEEQFRG